MQVQKTAFHQMEDADFLSDVGNGHDNTEQTEITEITMHMDSEQVCTWIDFKLDKSIFK